MKGTGIRLDDTYPKNRYLRLYMTGTAATSKATNSATNKWPIRTRPRPLPPVASTLQCDVIAIDFVAPVRTQIPGFGMAEPVDAHRQLPVPSRRRRRRHERSTAGSMMQNAGRSKSEDPSSSATSESHDDDWPFGLPHCKRKEEN